MQTYSIEKARQRLSQLVAAAHTGKTVIITAENGTAVTLVPSPPKLRKPRKAGSARGQVWMAADFDAPLDDFADYM